jgi:N-glycosylase/DNA lyase
MRIDADPAAPTLTITLPLPRGGARMVRVEGRRGSALLTVLGPKLSDRSLDAIAAQVAAILRLEADLSPFYAMIAEDPDLSWAAAGAGRMIRSATVFEEVVKTICTTNCAWSATQRMVGAFVEHLGVAAPGAPAHGPGGRSFPTPRAMAGAGENFYRDIARAGYRSAFFVELARRVVQEEVDLEALGRATPGELSDEDLEAALLELPGVGPYAAAHVMTMLGRSSRLILDSWTRPTYAKLVGRTQVSDAAITRRFRHYRQYAGLAFWVFLTRDWVAEPTP